MNVLDMISKHGSKWKKRVEKSQAYKDYGSKDYDPFAHGYALGWYKALQAFKGWLNEK